MLNGILIVDKPAGMTSHDVVARCRKALGIRRIGHAGTLDPDATGVLVLGVARATRLLQFLEAHEKTYVTTFVLGVETTTLDASGDVVETKDASSISKSDVESALARFRGEIQQVPPMVSAIKVGGERLYEKARRGETVERAPRHVTIHELTLESFDPPTLRIRCSKGTYIRTLVADLGTALGVGAHIATLRRTACGPYDESAATPLADVGAHHLIPMERAVEGFHRRDLTSAEALQVVQGKRLPAIGETTPYALFANDTLIAMARDYDDVTKTLCVLSTEVA